VNVGSVIDDLVFRDRWRILILVPKKAHALGNVKSIDHLLIAGPIEGPVRRVAAEQANLDAGNTPTKCVRTGYSFNVYTTAQPSTSPVSKPRPVRTITRLARG
jgi:hypothetical protein